MKTTFYIIALSIFVSGCNTSDETQTKTSSQNIVSGITTSAPVEALAISQDASSSLEGTAYLTAPIHNASITAYIVNVDGTRGDAVAKSQSLADGKFTLKLSQKSSPLLISVSGGTVTDPYTLEESDLTTLGLDIVAFYFEGSSIAVNPLSNAIAARAAQLNSQYGLRDGHRRAEQELKDAFHLRLSHELNAIHPSNPALSLIQQRITDSSDEAKLSLLLVALSVLASDRSTEPSKLALYFGLEFGDDGALNDSSKSGYFSADAVQELGIKAQQFLLKYPDSGLTKYSLIN